MSNNESEEGYSLTYEVYDPEEAENHLDEERIVEEAKRSISNEQAFLLDQINSGDDQQEKVSLHKEDIIQDKNKLKIDTESIAPVVMFNYATPVAQLHEGLELNPDLNHPHRFIKNSKIKIEKIVGRMGFNQRNIK